MLTFARLHVALVCVARFALLCVARFALLRSGSALCVCVLRRSVMLLSMCRFALWHRSSCGDLALTLCDVALALLWCAASLFDIALHVAILLWRSVMLLSLCCSRSVVLCSWGDCAKSRLMLCLCCVCHSVFLSILCVTLLLSVSLTLCFVSQADVNSFSLWIRLFTVHDSASCQLRDAEKNKKMSLNRASPLHSMFTHRLLMLCTWTASIVHFAVHLGSSFLLPV